MTFHIDVQNKSAYSLNTEKLQLAVTYVLNQHDAHPDSSLSIVFVDNDYVQNLNRQFRGIDAPTDVLSFPADTPPVEIEDEPPYLGDLIIAYPYASAQAARENHQLDDSLSLLVIHGTLHLLGYDHDTPENRAEMWSAQAEVLTALAISPDIVPALEESSNDSSH
ncbi:MAG: rRNA maturation RNase YbeY [Anaerolineae bacterium]|nr:rRNA maturation RNase YbeY [Anaerolineae bacterium]MBN8617691.1 rRNA maturation RNase YbeY [Anaerolineae bacterium]